MPQFPQAGKTRGKGDLPPKTGGKSEGGGVGLKRHRVRRAMVNGSLEKAPEPPATGTSPEPTCEGRDGCPMAALGFVHRPVLPPHPAAARPLGSKG